MQESDGAQDTILEVRDATVTYDMDRGQARVLDDINLDIERGETFGVAGESGCGKSMLASGLLDGVPEPGILSGEITYYPQEGDPIDLLELSASELRRVRWEEIAMVFQGAMNSFNPVKPIKSHFIDTINAHNADKEARMEHARELLVDLNLDPDRILSPETYGHNLSGGQKQRVLIALSLLLEPEVLVLDEPTASLDLLMQRNILGLLQDVKERFNLTMVVVSHDLPIISAFADRVGVMYAFEMVEKGDVDDVLYNASHPYARSLLRATPDLMTPLEGIQTVEGTSPDPVNTPSGCSFHPRCPVADDRCEIEDPNLVEMDEGTDHRAACFYTDQGKEAISTVLSKEDDQ